MASHAKPRNAGGESDGGRRRGALKVFRNAQSTETDRNDPAHNSRPSGTELERVSGRPCVTRREPIPLPDAAGRDPPPPFAGQLPDANHVKKSGTCEQLLLTTGGGGG